MTWRRRHVDVMTSVATTARASCRHHYVIAVCVRRSGQVTAVRHAPVPLTHLTLITIRHLLTSAAHLRPASTASALRLITSHPYFAASVFQVSLLFLNTWSEPTRIIIFTIIMVALLNRETIYIFMLWFVMVALWNRADHYIFALWLLLSSFFYSSHNLSRRRLDVCHTSTHGVALVRI